MPPPLPAAERQICNGHQHESYAHDQAIEGLGSPPWVANWPADTSTIPKNIIPTIIVIAIVIVAFVKAVSRGIHCQTRVAAAGFAISDR
jgi:hypothetical protein